MNEAFLKKVFSQIMRKNVYDIIYNDTQCGSIFEIPMQKIDEIEIQVIVNCYNGNFNWLSIETNISKENQEKIYLEDSGRNTKNIKICADPLIKYVRKLVKQIVDMNKCNCVKKQ